MSEKTIHFVITGGTIDSYYDSSKDTAVPNEKSIIPNFIKSLKLYNPVEFTNICMKDSRDIIESDLKKILITVEKSSNKKIIITHGTYTMPDTARFLKANLKRKDQTIIIMGSMIPLVGFSPSDGPFSIGYSIAKIQDLKPGIYICMNGRVFSPEEVMKVGKEGKFISIFGEGK
ncbi:asparaginase [Candidatus Parcubacteria bacterium]|nr:asparaginase [Candidatus Parcubacteria bacterium]